MMRRRAARTTTYDERDLRGVSRSSRCTRQTSEDRRRRVLGPDHPDTLNSAYDLATNLAALGQQEAARTLETDT
jgi:tetratricopeptide repeat protein